MRFVTAKERKAAEKAAALAKKATSKNPVAIKRVNLIFHGLMAFRNCDRDSYDVLIPRTRKPCFHEAKYGNPCHGGLHDFPSSTKMPTYYKIQGLTSAGNNRSLPSATDTLVILDKCVDEDPSGVLVSINVPKPTFIRHYRGSETHGANVSGGDAATLGVMKRNPDVLHEVTVFSYVKPCVDPKAAPRLLSADRKLGVDFAIPRPSPRHDTLNIGIYSQPTDHCFKDDSMFLNAMFKLKGKNTHTSFDIGAVPPNVAGVRVDDGPPVKTGIGINICQLLALSELKNPTLLYRLLCPFCGGLAAKKTTVASAVKKMHAFSAIPGGCGSGFSDDDGQ